MSASRLDSLLQYLQKDPHDSFTRYAIALEYVSEGEVQTGIEYLEDLIKRDPGYIGAYQQLGLLYERVDRRNDAVAVLKRGIEVASQSGDTHAAAEMRAAIDELQ